MKKSELEIGKVYAYSTKPNPDRIYQISAFKVADLDPKLGWSDSKGSVAGNYINSNGELGAYVKLLPRYIIGDYQEWKHRLELRSKDREIAELKRSIEMKKAQEVKNTYTPVFTDIYKVKSWEISADYNGKMKIELTHSQFTDIARDLKRYNIILEEEQAKRQAEWDARNNSQPSEAQVA